MRTLLTLFVVSAFWVSITLVNGQAASAGKREISPTGLLNKTAGLSWSDEFNHFTQRRRRARARALKRATPRPGTLRPGIWGGQHVGLNVTPTRVEIELDCAHGTIDQPIRLDREGRFDALGTFVQEGGPISVPVDRMPVERKNLSARYRGRVEGDRLLLEITPPESGAALDVLTVTYDKRPTLEKCY